MLSTEALRNYKMCVAQAPLEGLFAFECAYPTVKPLGQIALIEPTGSSRLLFYKDGKFAMVLNELLYCGAINQRGETKNNLGTRKIRLGYELLFIDSENEPVYSRPVQQIHSPAGRVRRLSA